MSDRRRSHRLTSVLAAVATAGALVFVPIGARTAGASAASSIVDAPTFSPTLSSDGTINLSHLGSTATSTTAGTGRPASERKPRVIDRQAAAHERHAGASRGATAAATPISPTNVPGEKGFLGLTGAEQAATAGGSDLEPPDQGLCVGDGYVTEFVNNALAVYRPDGTRVVRPVPSHALFKRPAADFFSDPRCYFDGATKRWFLTEFIVGTVNKAGQATSPSVQFVDVSNSADPTGTYHVWSFQTTDVGTANCPCFGDYDVFGADGNGIYITTDEFSTSGAAYNGVIMYAVSKQLLEASSATGIAPAVFGYRLTSDYFGQPYLLSPSDFPQGSAPAANTEYFVESNGNALSDTHLAVYALHNTSLLAASAPPSLYVTEVSVPRYSYPSPATQKKGPIPLGKSSFDPEGKLQADFDAVMHTTYTRGRLFAELDTATTSGTDAAAWYVLRPHLSGDTLTATLGETGTVAPAGQNLLYPDIAVGPSGDGYMVFALTGPKYYPSAAYISFGPKGATGPIHIAKAGAGPDDGFTCYAAFVGPNYGGCRWGDYSMGVFSGGRTYLATEMIPPSSARDHLSNWGTYVWSAAPGA